MTRHSGVDRETLQDDVSKAMKVVAKGGILVLASLVLSYVIAFVQKLIILRSLSTADYGILSLGLSIIALCAVIAGLGLSNGAQRYVALYRGKGDIEGAKGTIYGTAIMFAIAALAATAVLMATSGYISSLLDKPGLGWVLFILAILLPISGVTDLIISYYQGFEIVTAKVIGRICRALLPTIAVALAAVLFDTLHSIVLAILIGNVLALVVMVVYMFDKGFPGLSEAKHRIELRKPLLFSLPLGISVLASQVMLQTDTIMLGYFKASEQVGIYNAAVPIYNLLPVFLLAVAFIYSPVAARMIGQRKNDELRLLYPNVTKWLYVLTLPAWFMFFFYPSEVLRLLFGSRYVEASLVLQILVVGEFVHTIAGPNIMTLIAYGKSVLVMLDTVSVAVLNVVLNLLLIPRFGISGAATATAISLIIRNIVVSGQIYYLYRITPFDKDYAKTILGSILGVGLLYYPLKRALGLTLWILPIFYLLFLAASFGAVLVTRSVDETDLALYKAVKGRFLALLPEKLRKLLGKSTWNQ